MKKLTILCLIFILCGCQKPIEVVKTIITEDNTKILAINYPTTNIKELDKTISKYINKIKNDFQKKAHNENIRSELNIDYSYNIVSNRYYSVLLNILITHSESPHPTIITKSFNYDKITKKFINLDTIINQTNKKDVINTIKTQITDKYKSCLFNISDLETIDLNHDTFYFDKLDLKVFFNPYILTSGNCGILEISIPYDFIKHFTTTTNKNHEFTIPVIKKDPHSSKMIALTFDDGPSHYTNRIIEYLNTENIVATFFLLGNKVNSYGETIRKTLSYGNEIGNHSYNHKLLTNLKPQDIKAQIDKTQAAIYAESGYTPSLLRPTYGSLNQKIKNASNLTIALWTVDTLDWKIKDSKKIAKRALHNIKKDDIILMHDTYERTLKALKIMIPKLKEDGFTFVTVSELKKAHE